MPVEDRRRAQLRTAATVSLSEEAADTLMELVTPSGHEAATRQDIDGVLTAMNLMDERLSRQLTTMDQQWTERLKATEHRLTATFERGLREAITSQTRTLVVSLLVSVVAIAGVALSLAG